MAQPGSALLDLLRQSTANAPAVSPAATSGDGLLAMLAASAKRNQVSPFLYFFTRFALPDVR